MSTFEASLEQRHRRRLDHIAVDEETLAEAVSPDVNFAVDLENRRLVRRDQ